MSETGFKPVLYLKRNCPFCLKVQLFLLESGQLGQVEARRFTPGTEEEDAIRATLAPHFGKPSFPTLQTGPASFLDDFDAIIAHFAQPAGGRTADLPVFTAYADGVLPQMLELHAANVRLRAQLGE